MNRSLLALLAIVAVAAGAYYYIQIKKPQGAPTETTPVATQTAGDSEPLLFTWENWADPPFLAEYKAKYGVEPRTAIWADEDEAFAKMRTGYKPDVMAPCSYEFGR